MYANLNDLEDDDSSFAYLWSLEKIKGKEKSIVVGGFCFRKRDWGGYGFQWIWLHPYLRYNGLLTDHWEYLKEKFGNDFYCEPPYSAAMERFLSKDKYKIHKENKGKIVPLWIDDINGVYRDNDGSIKLK